MITEFPVWEKSTIRGIWVSSKFAYKINYFCYDKYTVPTKNKGEICMSIGQTIKLYRREKGLTQSELAELIGVSMQAVSKWETNAGMPDIAQIVPLARVLEISTDEHNQNIKENMKDW